MREQKSLGWGSLIVVLVVMTFAAIVGEELGTKVPTGAAAPQKSVEEQLYEGFVRAANESNSRGPIMVDDDTRWDRSIAGPGPRITYLYSFPKYSSRDINRAWVLAKLEPIVKKQACSSGQLKRSLEYGGTYVYAYSGNDGIEIARFNIDRNDCGY